MATKHRQKATTKPGIGGIPLGLFDEKYVCEGKMAIR
jgi:hypothetical protein